MAEDIRDIIKAIDIMRSGEMGVAPGGIRDNILNNNQREADLNNKAFNEMNKAEPDLDLMIEAGESEVMEIYKAIMQGVPVEEIVNKFGAKMIRSLFLPHLKNLQESGQALNKLNIETP